MRDGWTQCMQADGAMGSTNFVANRPTTLKAELPRPSGASCLPASPRHRVTASPRRRGGMERLGVPVRYASADEPTLRGADRIGQQWEAARLEMAAADKRGALLVLEEIQKIPAWSESVKRLSDEDTRAKRPLKLVLLGSAPLLIGRGPTESLAGRFETLHLPHWPFAEMRDAFGWSLDDYVFHGGYPGAAPRTLPRVSGQGPVLQREAFDMPGGVIAAHKHPLQRQGVAADEQIQWCHGFALPGQPGPYQPIVGSRDAVPGQDVHSTQEFLNCAMQTKCGRATRQAE